MDAVAMIGIHDGHIPDFRATTQYEIDESSRLLFVRITRARRFLLYVTDIAIFAMCRLDSLDQTGSTSLLRELESTCTYQTPKRTLRWLVKLRPVNSTCILSIVNGAVILPSQSNPIRICDGACL